MASLKKRSIVAGLKAYQWLEHRLGLIEPLSKAAVHQRLPTAQAGCMSSEAQRRFC